VALNVHHIITAINSPHCRKQISMLPSIQSQNWQHKQSTGGTVIGTGTGTRIHNTNAFTPVLP
jgi:hypothetical protein